MGYSGFLNQTKTGVPLEADVRQCPVSEAEIVRHFVYVGETVEARIGTWSAMIYGPDERHLRKTATFSPD